MSEQYRYIDPDYTYTDPKTGVLRNLANVTDRDTLILIESGAVAKRISELETKPLRIKGANELFAIHKYLFQDVYSWAGEVRTVEISKGNKPFFPLSHFYKALQYIDTLVSEFLKIDRKEKRELAHKLAEILDNINFLHPFREGNGRTQREFLRLLALRKKLKLNLNPPDNADIYERYMSGTINGDVEQLSILILEIITK